jgi:hypothetical protein
VDSADNIEDISNLISKQLHLLPITRLKEDDVCDPYGQAAAAGGDGLRELLMICAVVREMQLL